MKLLALPLGPNERVVYAATLHPALVFFKTGVVLVAFVAGLFVEVVFSGALLPVLVAVALQELIVFKSTAYVVTESRVLVRTGIFSVRVREMALGKVETIGLEQSLFARLLGAGTVTAGGSGGTTLSFSNMSEPAAFRQRMQVLMEQQRAVTQP